MRKKTLVLLSLSMLMACGADRSAAPLVPLSSSDSENSVPNVQEGTIPASPESDSSPNEADAIPTEREARDRPRRSLEDIQEALGQDFPPILAEIPTSPIPEVPFLPEPEPQPEPETPIPEAPLPDILPPVEEPIAEEPIGDEDPVADIEPPLENPEDDDEEIVETSPEEEQTFLSLLASQKVINTVDVRKAKGWGTSKDKRIKVFVAVDDRGRAIVPRNIRKKQIRGSTNGRDDEKFQDDRGPIKSLHSVLKICNQSDRNLSMKSGSGTPFASGDTVINPGNCAQYLVEDTDNIDGRSFDRLAGDNRENTIFFELVKIGPDGRRRR